MNGYIKLYRKVLEWEWHDEPITVATFIYCLLRANYDLQRWHGELVQPGQFITSMSNMASDIGISRQNLKTAINHLKSTHTLTTKSTNKWTLVTIEKWAEYQSAGEKVTNGITNGLTNELTSNQLSTNQQPTTIKEYKEYKENKKDINYKEQFQPVTEVEEGALELAHAQFASIKEQLRKGAY